MFKKILASVLVVATVAGASLAATGSAEARYYRYGHGPGWGGHGPGYGYGGGWHHGGRGGAIAGGVAAGLLGGVLLGGALSNRDRYYDDDYAPVYAPRCYWQSQRVPNSYDYGWHVERVRVCD